MVVISLLYMTVFVFLSGFDQITWHHRAQLGSTSKNEQHFRWIMAQSGSIMSEKQCASWTVLSLTCGSFCSLSVWYSCMIYCFFIMLDIVTDGISSKNESQLLPRCRCFHWSAHQWRPHSKPVLGCEVWCIFVSFWHHLLWGETGFYFGCLFLSKMTV